VFDGKHYKIGAQSDTDAGPSSGMESDALEPMEYAVKMRVVPENVLLKNKFKAGTLSTDDIQRTAMVIAKFHKNTGRSTEIDKFGTIEKVRFNTDENFLQTQEFIGSSISEEQFNTLKMWTDDFYKDNTELFQDRINAGRIRDCHGDLHMEHVCLTEPIKIIDCIEFNQRFRYSDTASDLAFLLMDLEYHGGNRFSEILYDSYRKYSGEKGSDLELIVKYYKVYRAYVRGKVTSFRLNDPSISVSEKNEAKSVAQKYFALAYEYVRS